MSGLTWLLQTFCLISCRHGGQRPTCCVRHSPTSQLYCRPQAGSGPGAAGSCPRARHQLGSSASSPSPDCQQPAYVHQRGAVSPGRWGGTRAPLPAPEEKRKSGKWDRGSGLCRGRWQECMEEVGTAMHGRPSCTHTPWPPPTNPRQRLGPAYLAVADSSSTQAQAERGDKGQGADTVCGQEVPGLEFGYTLSCSHEDV